VKPTQFNTDVYDMIQDLKSAIKEMPNKPDMNWSRKNYELTLYTFSKSLYLKTPKDSLKGYTLLSSKTAQKLIDWLNLAWIKIIEFEG